jgi:hypothetical protein
MLFTVNPVVEMQQREEWYVFVENDCDTGIDIDIVGHFHIFILSPEINTILNNSPLFATITCQQGAIRCWRRFLLDVSFR